MNLRSRALAIAAVVASIGAPLHAESRITATPPGTRVTDVQNVVVGGAAFAVPADYVDVVAPPLPRTIIIR